MYKTKASLVLASASPRRKDLLCRMGLDFRIVPSQLDEESGSFPEPKELAGHWARQKALAVARMKGESEDHWYLGVDTIVVIEGEVLGKPGSPQEACDFLGRLSDRWHEVISGYCITHPPTRTMVENTVTSGVKMKKLDPGEIEAYVATGEPLDKAGAYAVQGIGAFMVEQIRGSYTNVVGLPLTEVVSDLIRLDIIQIM